MSRLDDVFKQLGFTIYDDLTLANKRIAELEAENASLRARTEDIKHQWWEREDLRTRKHTLAEELVIELGLQRCPPGEALQQAVAKIRILEEFACGLAAQEGLLSTPIGDLPLFPVYKPDTWSLWADDGGASVNDLLGELVEHAECEGIVGDVIQVTPVWTGRSRFCVVSPVFSDHESPEEREIVDHEVRVFLNEDEAKAHAESLEKEEAGRVLKA